MANIIPVRYAVGGKGVFEIITSSNIPQGTHEVSRQEFISGIQDFLNNNKFSEGNDVSYKIKLQQAQQNINPDPRVASWVAPWGETLSNLSQSQIDYMIQNYGKPGYYSPEQLKAESARLASTTPQQSTASNQSLGYPTQSLKPGDNGDTVKKLQDYLVSKGYMTQTDVNTGYGIYGPKTTTAVTKLQQDLKVDNSSGPGYFGTKTLQALSSQSSSGGSSDGGGTSGPAGTGGTGGTSATVDYTAPVTGVEFKNSDAYKSLSPELQKLVDMGYSVYLKGGEAEAKIFSDSLTKATELADPYAKAQLGLFRATFLTQIAKTESDYSFAADALQKTRDQLAQDLKNNKDYLNLSQQADMATALRNYDNDLLTIGDQAAEKGITFATGARSRALAEDQRTAQYQDVIQSSNRDLNFKINELTLQAQRGDTQAKDKLDQLNANQGFDLASIGQNAEKILGSTGAADLGVPRYTPSGGNLGTVEQERRKSIIDLSSLSIA